MTAVGARERKPTWLRAFIPDNNLAHLAAVVCPGCGLWVVEDREGVWERWDYGIVEGDDLAVAVLLNRPLARVQWDPAFRQPMLTIVSGGYGLDPRGAYLTGHECGLARVSVKPFKPPRKSKPPGGPWGVPVDSGLIEETMRVMRAPLASLRK